MFAALAAVLFATNGAIAAAVDRACLNDATTETGALVEDARALRLPDGRLLRLAGIEPFSLLVQDGDEAEAAARDRLESLIAGASLRVRLLSQEPDRYGRLPALLATGDASLAQVTLAGEGLALAFATGAAVPCFAAIQQAEDEARKARRGFWRQAQVLKGSPDSLAAHIGRFAIFEGVVLSVGNRRARTYLNFGRRWSTDVTVEIGSKAREGFGGEAVLAGLTGRTVRVRGYVEERSGPLIRLTSPMQIELLGGAVRK